MITILTRLARTLTTKPFMLLRCSNTISVAGILVAEVFFKLYGWILFTDSLLRYNIAFSHHDRLFKPVFFEVFPLKLHSKTKE